jgi:hypothetical protein
MIYYHPNVPHYPKIIVPSFLANTPPPVMRCLHWRARGVNNLGWLLIPITNSIRINLLGLASHRNKFRCHPADFTTPINPSGNHIYLAIGLKTHLGKNYLELYNPQGPDKILIYVELSDPLMRKIFNAQYFYTLAPSEI